MDKVESFEDLTCWKVARELKIAIYKLAKRLPGFEQYALSSQMRRAAVSVTANIAEGFGRFSYTEKIRYAKISRSSALEVKDHVYSCLDAEYINKEEFDAFIGFCDETTKKISGYISYIWNQKSNTIQ